jgi:hypothetical protein
LPLTAPGSVWDTFLLLIVWQGNPQCSGLWLAHQILELTGQPTPGRLGQPSPGRLGQPSPGRLGQPSPGRLGQPSPGRLDQPSPGNIEDTLGQACPTPCKYYSII